MADIGGSRRGATILGLFLALGVPVLLGPTGLMKQLIATPGTPGVLMREGVLWGQTLLVTLVLTVGEGQSLAAIGFRRPRWSTLIWGVAAFIAGFLIQPLSQFLLQSMGGSFPTQALTKFAGLPAWVLALIVVRAAVVEEILFRGYGIERVTALTGSRILGVLVPSAAFVLAHIQTWGITYAIAFVGPIALLMSGLYLWRRDIGSNMIAHFLTDAVGVSAAYFSAHG
jgi:membrane protease YdiL (CAAX protease family)